jgi:hypothetical protein
MWLDMIGVVILASHFVAIGGIVLWFGLGKPTSRHEFWLRFKKSFFSF